MAIRTFPDWGISPSQLPAPEGDLAEIPARLGSIASYRRTGRVVLMNEFGGGLFWKMFSGPGGTAYLVAGNAYFGYISTKLVPPDMGGDTILAKALPLYDTKVGMEWWVNPLNAATTNITGDFFRNITSIPREYVARWRINTATSNLEILTNTLPVTYAVIAPIHPRDNQKLQWFNVKMVVDFNSKFYSRLYFDNQLFDISTYPLPNVGGSVTLEVLYVYIRAEDTTGAKEPVQVDGFIYTVNEF